VGYGDGSPLGNRLKQTGSALTIHVSELELAHPSLQTLLASLLDGELVTADGSRLPVGEGVTVVIETNATASARVRGSLGFGAGGASAAGARTAAFGAAVDALLDPRLSSRIAALGRSYVLGPLGPADVAAVLQHAAREAGRPYGVEVHLSDDAAADLAARARDPEGGARPALGLLAEEVLARLDDRLAAGPPPTRIEIRREDGRLVLDTGEE
jgi:ATP-dependent Clp protease ATP-binding subunit ClpA